MVLVIGVNGVGKTTSVAKLAHRLQRSGKRVLLGAADTYRAGAIAQLQVWAERLGVPCVSGAPGGDPAAVAFDAVDAGLSRSMDVVLIDTAGRLHTQDGLMAELGKVVRVVGKKLPGAPHEVLLVLDGSVGQNAVQQGRMFAQVVKPTGLIVTKLDGTARGGAVVALRRELELPIRFIGTGETLDDLEAVRCRENGRDAGWRRATRGESVRGELGNDAPMRVALVAIAFGTLLILAAFGSAWTPGGAPPWGVWCMIAGSALVMAATMALGALRSGVRRRRVDADRRIRPDRDRGRVRRAGAAPGRNRATARWCLACRSGSPSRSSAWACSRRWCCRSASRVAFRADGLDDGSLAELRRRAAALRAGS